MSPRKRNAKNKGLPDNLYARVKNGVTYFEYQRPDNSKTHGMGTKKAMAVEAAIKLNGILIKGNSLADKITGKASFSSVADSYRVNEIEKDAEIRDSTRKNYIYQIEKIKAAFINRAISTIETMDVAEFLDSLANDSYRNHRRMFLKLMDYAITKGLIKHNPVTPTKSKLKGVAKTRQRLTKDQYKSIRKAAPDWFKVAMDLSLLLCIGRNEAVTLRHGDEKEGALLLERLKTDKYESSRVAVKITPALREVLNRAKSLPPLSQYIVSKPRRRGQVSPDMITREFKRIATSIGIFDHLDPNQWPTPHEIRALGSHLLESVEGRETGNIQTLMTHSSEKQTKEYLAGHEEKKYAPAQAGNTILW